MKKIGSFISLKNETSLQDLSIEDYQNRFGDVSCPGDSLLVSPVQKTSFRLRADSFETDSELSREDGDSMPEISNLSGSLPGETMFRQIDYLWLFNPFLHFSKRQKMTLDESTLSV